MINKKVALIILTSAILAITALTVMAQQTTTSPSKVKTPDLSCIKSAVIKREDALQTAWQKLSNSITSALQTRETKLTAAWDIADKKQRKDAIQAAWSEFKRAKKSAVNTHRQERIASWEQFKKDRRACGSVPTWENPGADISL